MQTIELKKKNASVMIYLNQKNNLGVLLKKQIYYQSINLKDMEKKSIATTNVECQLTHQTLILMGFLAESRKQYDIEKNAKNNAYSFIIQIGLLDQFNEFSKHYKDIDHHAACIDMLTADF